MSMSTHVVGFKAPDEKWKKMKAVYDSCNAAKIAIPEEVEKFFGWALPDDRGVEVDLEKMPAILKEWKDDSREGYEIDVKRIPADITHIRFYNSW